MTHEAETRIPKIVCIDDDARIIELLTLILKKTGFEGLGAQSGPEGLELIATAKPDLVLLDLMMPEMDGWQVYQIMKKDEAMRTIPVIIVSSKAQPIDIALAIHIAKVDGYITKPFTLGQLEESINKVLNIPAKVLQQ
jgi:CheY-like chemotaxis protein